jgi:hypothetical protein
MCLVCGGGVGFWKGGVLGVGVVVAFVLVLVVEFVAVLDVDYWMDSNKDCSQLDVERKLEMQMMMNVIFDVDVDADAGHSFVICIACSLNFEKWFDS